MTNPLNGTNTLAVEVHQWSPQQSDVAFGLELDAEYIAPPALEIPTLEITRSNNMIHVWWPGSPWKLESKTNLQSDAWLQIETDQTPFVTPDLGQQFFQIRRP